MTDPDGPAELITRPAAGRLFTARRRVRLGDVRTSGRLRLDALNRYTQDVSNDDTTDAHLPDDLAWVVRRTTVDVVSEAVFGEELEFVTFCSGLGGRWAERRLGVVGSLGAHYEVATLWIHLDEGTGRPRRLSDHFLDLYGEAAQGRKVAARLVHGDPPPDGRRLLWPLRRVDFDLFGHVNNAAYWSVLEERLPEWPDRWAARTRFTVEYRDGVVPGEEVEIVEWASAEAIGLWWMTGTSSVAASARVEAMASHWYAESDRKD